MSGAEAVPLLLLAGSPGAGKTTLLARWVAEPAFGNTAVLVNEPGDAAIDAHLVGGLAGATRALLGGCACCTARRDLARAIESLAGARRGAPRFDRVVVELSGLAHPAPVLEALAADEGLRERFPLHGLATLVDAAAGVHALDGAHARARAAAADVLVLAKTDQVAAADAERLARELARLNPDAEIVRSDASLADAAEVWEAARNAPGRELRHLEAALEGAGTHEDIRTHTLRLEAPVELSGFCLRLAGFLQEQGGRVLRVKGLVGVQGRHGPAVIQAVGPALHPVRTLKEWPAGAAPGALVVVARGLDEAKLRAALLAPAQDR